MSHPPITITITNSTPINSSTNSSPFLFSVNKQTNKQIHVSFEKGISEAGPALSDRAPISSRHPCFSLPSQEALTALQERIYEHHIKGLPASAEECDKPGGENSGSKVSLFPLSPPPPRDLERFGAGLIPFFFPHRASSSQLGSLLETLLVTGWNSPYSESVVFCSDGTWDGLER